MQHLCGALEGDRVSPACSRMLSPGKVLADNEGSIVNLQVEYFIRRSGGTIVERYEELEGRLRSLAARGRTRARAGTGRTRRVR